MMNYLTPAPHFQIDIMATMTGPQAVSRMFPIPFSGIKAEAAAQPAFSASSSARQCGRSASGALPPAMPGRVIW